MKVEVFDPPMCCSSGVCGPNVDPALPRFAADLEWVKNQGVVVSRFNLVQQPMVFAEKVVVRTALTEDEHCLPLVMVDGQIVSRGKYPSRGDLAVSICISLRARNESPREKFPALAELADQHSTNGAFISAEEPCRCCGSVADGQKTSKCCG